MRHLLGRLVSREREKGTKRQKQRKREKKREREKKRYDVMRIECVRRWTYREGGLSVK